MNTDKHRCTHSKSIRVHPRPSVAENRLTEVWIESAEASLRQVLGVSRGTALRLLKEWIAAGWLESPRKTRGLGAIYAPGAKLLHRPQIASQAAKGDAMTPEGGAIQT